MSKARKKLAKLEKAADKFKSAIYSFGDNVETETVGLDEWVESIDETLYDIQADIDSMEEDED